MKYTCIPVEEDGEFFWCIIEHATGLVVGKHYFEDEAEDYLKFLQAGGAFDGYTPAFIVSQINYKSSLSLDEKFVTKLTA